jgi:hypothetical protein
MARKRTTTTVSGLPGTGNLLCIYEPALGNAKTDSATSCNRPSLPAAGTRTCVQAPLRVAPLPSLRAQDIAIFSQREKELDLSWLKNR